MEEEDLGSLRAEWSRTVRADMFKKLFSNAPKRSKCKICKVSYPNSITTGSSIVHCMCPECITGIIGKRKVKKINKPVEVKPMVIKEEDLMTLKDYLEMKI